jgi:CheY-like chemotaxis protein
MGHLLPYHATTAPDEFAGQTQTLVSATTSINASSKSALLVENDESLSNLLRRYLKDEGYVVRTASNCEEGLRLYRDFAPFNVVLIDYCVPERSDIEKRPDYCSPQTKGTELVKAIRHIAPSQGIIILASDFPNVVDVPRPPELKHIPLLVDLSAPRLRIALERIEVDRAVRVLTRPEQLRLQQFAKFRVRGLGRAAGGRGWQDLLQEALYRTLIGASDASNGRHWNKKVDLVKHLTEAMRSIASSWKRQFTTDEANTYLVSELQTCDAEGEEYSAADNVASGHAPADTRLIEMEEEDRILATLGDDPDATRVLEGWMNGLKKNEILPRYGLDEKKYAAAVRRIRMKLLGRRGDDNGI